MDVFPDIINNESENNDKNFVLKKIIIDASCSYLSDERDDPDKYKFYNSAIEHILINQFPEHNTKTSTITNLIKLQENNHAHYILMDVSKKSNPLKTIYGFCSIQSDNRTKVLYRTENLNDNGIEHICLWNVAKQPGLMSRGGICSMMLKMIKTHYNTKNVNTPIFLTVNPNNLAAVRCYKKQGFTFVRTIIDSKLRDIKPSFIGPSMTDLTMLYNRDYLFFKTQDPSQNLPQDPSPQDPSQNLPQYITLLPTTSQRFVLIAHGVLDTGNYVCKLPPQNITVTDVRRICNSGEDGYKQIVDMIPTKTENNENNGNNGNKSTSVVVGSQIKEYYFPFKHITFYSAPGTILSASADMIPKLSKITCFASNMINNTRTIAPTIEPIIEPIIEPTITKDEFNEGTRIALHNTYFTGNISDPSYQKHSIGLYHCNMGYKLVSYRDMCDEDSRECVSFGYDDVISHICNYCDENVIPYENVELSIYACQGLKSTIAGTNIDNNLHNLLFGEDEQQKAGGDGNITRDNPSIEKPSREEPVTSNMFQTRFVKRFVKFAESNMCQTKGGKRRKRHTYINPKHVKQSTRKIQIQMKHKTRSRRVKQDTRQNRKNHKTQKRNSKKRHTKKSRMKNRRNVKRIRIKMN